VPLLAALVSLFLAPMIHSHYLAGVFPALCLLIACTLEAGWRLGPRTLALVPAGVLMVVTPAALARMYGEPHKTDWRGVARRVDRDGGELPVYFYEDIGADPFAYYRPQQPLHRVTAQFGDDGRGWNKERDAMATGDGFWFVLYPTSSGTRAEEPAIDAWLNKEFKVEQRDDFAPMRVWLCRPRDTIQGTARAGKEGPVGGRP
jgi:hypothetical protein